jgi:hypothetical protein
MATPIGYVIGLWIVWILQVVLFPPKTQKTPVKTAQKARLVLRALGCWAIYIPVGLHRVQPIAWWRIAAGTALGLGGSGWPMPDFGIWGNNGG